MADFVDLRHLSTARLFSIVFTTCLVCVVRDMRLVSECDIWDPGGSAVSRVGQSLSSVAHVTCRLWKVYTFGLDFRPSLDLSNWTVSSDLDALDTFGLRHFTWLAGLWRSGELGQRPERVTWKVRDKSVVFGPFGGLSSEFIDLELFGCLYWIASRVLWIGTRAWHGLGRSLWTRTLDFARGRCCRRGATGNVSAVWTAMVATVEGPSGFMI
jgi:hypothetical protein